MIKVSITNSGESEIRKIGYQSIGETALPALFVEVSMGKEICKDCEDFKDRIKIAEQINEIFGTDGYWNFESCYKSCVKKSQKDEDYQRIKAKLYYHKNHPLALYR